MPPTSPSCHRLPFPPYPCVAESSLVPFLIALKATFSKPVNAQISLLTDDYQVRADQFMIACASIR
jgi:hypothetical protein